MQTQPNMIPQLMIDHLQVDNYATTSDSSKIYKLTKTAITRVRKGDMPIFAVPLSTEHLKNLGFREIQGRHLMPVQVGGDVMQLYWNPSRKRIEVQSTEEKDLLTLVHVRSIHQLQNLVKILTDTNLLLQEDAKKPSKKELPFCLIVFQRGLE